MMGCGMWMPCHQDRGQDQDNIGSKVLQSSATTSCHPLTENGRSEVQKYKWAGEWIPDRHDATLIQEARLRGREAWIWGCLWGNGYAGLGTTVKVYIITGRRKIFLTTAHVN